MAVPTNNSVGVHWQGVASFAAARRRLATMWDPVQHPIAPAASSLATPPGHGMALVRPARSFLNIQPLDQHNGLTGGGNANGRHKNRTDTRPEHSRSARVRPNHAACSVCAKSKEIHDFAESCRVLHHQSLQPQSGLLIWNVMRLDATSCVSLYSVRVG